MCSVFSPHPNTILVRKLHDLDQSSFEHDRSLFRFPISPDSYTVTSVEREKRGMVWTNPSHLTCHVLINKTGNSGRHKRSFWVRLARSTILDRSKMLG